MNVRDILDQLSELLLAGAETTSATIWFVLFPRCTDTNLCANIPSSYLFMEIARNPSIRKKLLSTLPELSVCDPLIDSVSVRTDPSYDYLNACIKGEDFPHGERRPSKTMS